MNSLLLQITSGRGPEECAWVASRLASLVIADARESGLDAELIECESGMEAGTLLSALVDIRGPHSEIFVAEYEGTVQWIGNSPFRRGHKRRNWFVGVERVALPEVIPFSEQDVKFEAMRATGPGGQHVNKTESAIRAVHLPTGLVAVSRDERSQFANRRRALERLSILVARLGESRSIAAQKARWDAHNELVRGNPSRVYEGNEFRLKKRKSFNGDARR